MSRITPKHYAIALYELLNETQSADERVKIVRQFLERIYRTGKLRLLSNINTAFIDYHYQRLNVLPVNVTVANASMTGDTITAELNRLLPNTSLAITTTVADKAVGGMIVETRNQRWNISVAGQLQALANTLKK
ncbi:MAG: F0F1 ATP synthase subunit delta [Patescibacteria group bacterium]|jgi:F0F1-type ATP synthase delta subunit